MRTATSRRVLASTLLATALLVAACTDDDGGSPATSSSVVARTSTTIADDGVLRIGVLLPDTGAAQTLGRPLAQAVDLAVAEVNQAGGVNGRAVEVVHADEGDGVAAAMNGVAELLNARVDAVIGPASTKVTLGVLDSFVDEGVVTCSPTAAGAALSDYPDNRLFVRSIPPDALQGVAIAEQIERAGVGNAAVLVPDDSFGRAYTDAISGALARRGISVTAVVPYDASDDQSVVDAVEQALALVPSALALVGDAQTGRSVLATAVSMVPPGVPIVVNDTLRSTSEIGVPSIDGTEIIGVAPKAGPAPGSSGWFTSTLATFLGTDPAELPASFAAHAYDCVSLITIAAEAAGRNTGSAISTRVIDISQGGANCVNFSSCQVLLTAGRNIDLNGASGPLELEADGDVSSGWFDRFHFDENGTDVTDGEFSVGLF